MTLGKFEVFALSDGRFALDGGAMFGVVPRVLWQKTNPPDERNRITLALRPLLIKTPAALVLVDTGIGTKQDQKFRDVYRVEQPPVLLGTLAAAGFKPEDVTHVINTHLHFDHCGTDTSRSGPQAAKRPTTNGQATPSEGATLTTGEDFRIVPTFPRANYCIQELEWEMATKPDVRSRASYRPENYMPIQAAGQLHLVSSDAEITPGVRVIHTGGHTRGHQSVVVESEGRSLIYWGDLIPTASHVNVPYVMGYDTMPLVTIEQKEKLLMRVAGEHWLMCFEHDPEIAFAHLESEENRFVLAPVK
jgi:glyoxylase-like metal-dependent hydrolase (beta-lactamase superfamily II)